MIGLISVIIPIYKAERYLQRCVASVVSQTYKSLEIILVDDGSPDRCGEMCDQYAKQDSRIIVIHQSNSGVSAARNVGLAVATGDWIMFVDSDDYIDLDLCEYLLKNAHLTGADIVQCDAMLEKNGESEHRICYSRKDNFPATEWKYMTSECWGKLYKRTIVTGLQFCTDYRLAEDLYFNVQAISRATHFYSTSEAKYHYVQTEGSLFRSESTKDSVFFSRKVIEGAMKQYSNNYAVCEYLRTEKMRSVLDVCSRIVCNHLERDMSKAIAEMQNEIRKEMYNILFREKFRRKEKVKFVLIAYAWPIYRIVLNQYKLRKQEQRRNDEKYTKNVK